MKINQLFALATVFLMLMSISTPALALETTTFSPQEMQETQAANQKIDAYVNNRSVARIIDQGSLEMTLLVQENGYYCGPASCCMVAATLDLGNFTQDQMANMLGTTTAGSSSDQITNTLNNLLAENNRTIRYQKTNTSVSSLVSSIIYSINAGAPVVVNVGDTPYYESGGHFVVVRAYRSGFAGSTSVNEATVCDPHHTYYGEYPYPMNDLVDACNSNVGNFVRVV